jgi:rhodanese-related sulfurtransferase
MSRDGTAHPGPPGIMTVAEIGRSRVVLIDVREQSERVRHGSIPGSLHVPYPELQEHVRSGRLPMS